MFRNTLYYTPFEFLRESVEVVIPKICRMNSYWGFINITISIEFLGKCIWEDEVDWNSYESKKSKGYFMKVFEVNGLKKYDCIKGDLWKSLRNGFSHSLVPKEGIFITDRIDIPEQLGRKPYTIRIDEYLGSFITTCKEIRTGKYSPDGRLTQPFIRFKRDHRGDIESSGY